MTSGCFEAVQIAPVPKGSAAFFPGDGSKDSHVSDASSSWQKSREARKILHSSQTQMGTTQPAIQIEQSRADSHGLATIH
ncbi:MAG: hypothetical protein WA435_09895 [Gallionellaceae bacterium]